MKYRAGRSAGGFRAMGVGLISMAALLMVGCGGGGAGSSTVATDGGAVSAKAEFIHRADGICRATDAEQQQNRKALLKKSPNAESTRAGQERMIYAAALPPLRKEGKQLSILRAPPGDQQKLDDLVEALVIAVGVAEREPGILLDPSDKTFAAASRLASQYGLEDCADPQ